MQLSRVAPVPMEVPREAMGRDEAASPTAITESIILTAVIDTKEGRDILIADVPNAFVQTGIEPKEKGERVIMKIRGPLVEMLVNIDARTYEPYVVEENNSKDIYVVRHCMGCFSPHYYITRNLGKTLRTLVLSSILMIHALIIGW